MKLGLVVLLACAGWAQPQPGTPAPVLTLEEVLAAVERSYPPLLAALKEADIADAEVLQALGRFDLNLRARLEADQFGFYPNERGSVGFDQNLQTLGASVYGGWRIGDGRFADYDGKLDTRSYGEFSGGFRVPLARNRAIDPRRAELRKSEIGRVIAKLSIAQQKLLIVQAATRRYWDWVAAGRRLEVARSLLAIAEGRDALLKEAVDAGQFPAIDRTDNQRAIFQRRSFLVEASRGIELASIDLSLFYRDAEGKPVLAKPQQLPPSFPAADGPSAASLEQDIETALSRRPEIERLAGQRRQTEIDAALARNQRLPSFELGAGFTAEAGSGAEVKRGPQELKASLSFDLPVQRRDATGKLRSAEAKIAQFGQREKFQRDQVAAEIRDAVSAIEAARQRVSVIREELRVTRELEAAERSRFELGDGTLFLLNLREQATADVALREVGTLQEYFRALAQYDLAIARGVRP